MKFGANVASDASDPKGKLRVVELLQPPPDDCRETLSGYRVCVHTLRLK